MVGQTITMCVRLDKQKTFFVSNIILQSPFLVGLRTSTFRKASLHLRDFRERKATFERLLLNN